MTKLLSWRLAEITDSDFEDFYRIKADLENIKWGGFTCPPEKKSFKEWYKSQIESSTREIYLVFIERKCVAFFYIDYKDNGHFLVPSGVLTEYTRQGIGTYIIEESDKIAKNKGYSIHEAWCSDKNIGSVKRFVKLGYTKTEEYDIRNLPLLGGNHKYYKWIKEI